MPTRKQRRRREKSFRHDYDYVVVDDEGNEVEVDPQALRAEKERAKPEKQASGGKAQPKTRGGSRAATTRVIQPPSWRRVLRRGAIFAPIMFVATMLIDHGRHGYALYLGQTVFLLAFFLPFSYVMDSMAYRMYLRRTGQAPQKEKESKTQATTRSPR
jgi:hypothetical protein